MSRTIKFANQPQDFYTALSQRVNYYFKSNQISRTANSEMVIKTIFMLLLYFVPYAISISGLVTTFPLYLLVCLVMGLGIAGIGLSIMHDANHGSYSNKPWVNDLLGYSLNVVGGNAFNWKIQHNVLHHTYTNVFDVDEDISPRGALRMAPESPWKSFHRFQFAYAWLLYGLLTLVWVFGKDFGRLVKYQREGLVKKQRANIYTEWAVLIATKAAYFFYTLALPMMLLPFAWWQILVGFLAMHYVAGFILAIVFQPAHVIDGTAYFQPDANGNLENNWAVHQLLTTTNFAHRNKILSWYVGGLNFQVEHHLFPNVCHVHYRHLSSIVRDTAREFGLPYKMKETFWDAMVAHTKLLKQLGTDKEFRPVMVSA
ncbi:MAG: acyl-CoA desaturase [Cyclobacteriaceae bacterium]|nr:acyl-CoA desaturase [Cyclobacteriaceae bacterium]